MRIQSLTIVGVGLIGASVGKAAKRRQIADHVVGVGSDAAMLDVAHQVGAIDEGILDLRAGVANADIIVFCTPVDVLAEVVLAAAPHCPAKAVLTDVGSTKGTIVRALERKLNSEVAFVGSHPLAGSEKSGPQFSHADLFRDRVVVMTPTSRSSPLAVSRIQQFWEALGSRVKMLTPEEHDQALAITSHLPHVLAAAIAGILPEKLFELTASGFRDTTRVAAGDPSLWTAIIRQNRCAMLDALQQLKSRLEAFEQAMANEDLQALHSLLAQGKKVRDALGS